MNASLQQFRLDGPQIGDNFLISGHCHAKAIRGVCHGKPLPTVHLRAFCAPVPYE